MTARTAAALVSLGLAVGTLGCLDFYEVPVDVPIEAKMDVSMFKRVLVAGFLAGGSKQIDPNTETARLLRSQLRSKSDLKVIDADVLSLTDEMNKRKGLPPSSPNAESPIQNAADMQAYEAILSDKAYWKQVGEEYQSPLIVTGSVLFTEASKTGVVQMPERVVEGGVEVYKEVQKQVDQKGFSLEDKFVFIDGRTGEQIHTESLHSDAYYGPDQTTPALSAYFELMDKIVPTFLTTLNTQRIHGTRVLIK